MQVSQRRRTDIATCTASLALHSLVLSLSSIAKTLWKTHADNNHPGLGLAHRGAFKRINATIFNSCSRSHKVHPSAAGSAGKVGIRHRHIDRGTFRARLRDNMSFWSPSGFVSRITTLAFISGITPHVVTAIDSTDPEVSVEPLLRCLRRG